MHEVLPKQARAGSTMRLAGRNRRFRWFFLNGNGHTDTRTYGRTYGRTDPFIEMRGRI